MIFVSLGTMDMPFFRMAKAVDEWAKSVNDRVIVQTGYTDYNYKNVEYFSFCTKPEMEKYIEEAEIVVLQGGWGAISEAMEKKKRIVVMPRYNRTEHIHDQFQLVRKLDKIGCVIGVFNEYDLNDKIIEARTHDFKYIKKGNAESLIKLKLKEWFG